MANPPSALPQGSWQWILASFHPAQVFLNYMVSLDAFARLIAANKIGPVGGPYANDAAAAAGGVAIGQLYRNGSVVQVRVT